MGQNPDLTVKIVAEDPDAEVAVVGGQVLESDASQVGQGVVVLPDGSLGIDVLGTGGPPSGAAGGDLGGAYPNPTLSAGKQSELDAKVATVVGGANVTVDATDPANPIVSSAGGGGSVATDTIWNAAGDLAVGTGPDTAAVLSPGTALQTLRVNAGATALEWATPGSPGADSVTNSILANVATATIKGRITAGTGDPEDLTQAQARTVLALTPGTDVQAFSAVLAATTASFLTADETKLDAIEALADVTDAGNVNAAGAVMESDYNANTILAATADNTPLPITLGASTILARLGSGDIIAATPAQLMTLLGAAPLASPTFTGTVVVPALPYDATTWNGSQTPATRDDVRDKFESLAQLEAGNGTSVDSITNPGFVSIDVDADLFAIGNLTSAADKLPYATGAQTWALADFTAAGRAILDDADNTAQRVTLGVEIGVNVQAYSAQTALRTDKLSVFAATTSAELLGVISNETGSGLLVFGTTPTLTTPVVLGASLGVARTSTSLPVPHLFSNSAVTIDYASGSNAYHLSWGETVKYLQAGTTATAANSLAYAAATIQNDASANVAIGTSRIFWDNNAIKADTQTGVGGGAYTSFLSSPTYSIANAGVMTSGTYFGITCSPAVGAGVTLSTVSLHTGAGSVAGTVTTWTCLKANNPTGAGTITTVYGLDIAALTMGGTNVGIRNLSSSRTIGKATFGVDAAAVYGIDLQATAQDAGCIGIAEAAATPTNPASSAGVVLYMKGDKMVIAFNHAGTMRYATYDLTQSATAVWATSTSAP